MSTTIEQKVVEMRFDNKQFESATAASMSTIEKLKQSLNFKESGKGFENLNAAAKKVDMSGISKSIETIEARFSSLQIVAATVLANITNSAFNYGKQIVSALSLDPVISGFQEYETQINSVQTILANTQSKGSTLDDVTAALDELNKYADQTIYNFTEMTRNIGTFTAAGVDLDKSVTSIKGIANLAAISGSSAQQASTAMYQLSQALAAGRVSLMDWNSVVNAGMGGEVFQNSLKRTATQMGKNVDALIEKYGSFRESLTQGEWLTADVLTETLTQLSGAYTEADLIAQGYTESQAKEIVELADTAVSAATDVKTFTQLMDTLKESLQSGWTQSWEIIIGDFEEAKELFSEISQVIGDAINKSAESRNNLLQGWKDLGGRTALIDSVRNSFEALVSVVTPVSEAFREIFPPLTAEQLYSFTENLRNLTANLKLSDQASANLKSTFKGLFAAVDIVAQAIGSIVKGFGPLVGFTGELGGGILGLTGSLGDYIVKLNDSVKAGEGFSVVTQVISDGIKTLSSGVSTIVGWFGGFGEIISTIGSVAGKVFSGLFNIVGQIATWIRENVTAGDIFAGLAGGGIFVLAKKLGGVADKIKEFFDSFGGLTDDVGGTFTSVLESVHDALGAFTQGIQVASLVGIAIAITLLTSSLRKISEIEPEKIAYSLATIAGMIKTLNSGFNSMSKSLAKFKPKGVISASVAMIAMAEAINILASAIQKLADLDMGQIAQGLFALGVMMAELTLSMKAMNKIKINLRTSVAIITLAESCKILSEALSGFSDLSWDEIARGLTSMAGALGELVAALAVLNKVAGFKSLLGSVGILVMVQSLDEISDALASIGALSWEEIGKGLTGMGVALAELVASLSILSSVGGFGALLGGTSILITVQSLDEIAAALEEIGGLSWDEIARGLVGMGGALTEVSVITGLLGKLAGFSGILGSGALLLSVQSLSDLADALEQFGGMSWDEIARGLVGMGGALTEVAAISGILGTLTNVFGFLGSGSLLLGIQGLDELANALQKFGSMSWDEIGRGLSAMGAALGEVALGGLLNTFSGLGATSIMTLAEPLGILADSVKKWIGLEIPEGLSLKLASLADGVGAFTLGGWGADAIATIARPMGVLADSVMKWSGVTVPDDIGSQLKSLADGVGAFTWKGWGANSLATVAPAMTQLVDAVDKWSSVNVPSDIADQLKGLAEGVGSFTWSFAGGWSLNAIVGPLGQLSDSVSKWSNVKVPDTLEEDLTGLANGVLAFTWAFAGGFSLSTIIDPLAKLPDSIKKWNGITVPDNLEEDLQSLAEGVKAFTWAFMGGWSMDTVVGPLGVLADSIKKWKGVSIPEGLEEGLSEIANGTKSFTWAFAGGYSLSTIAIPLGNLADSIRKWKGVSIPEGLGDQLSELSKGVKAFNFSGWGADAISSATSGIGDMAVAIRKWNGVEVPENLGSQLENLANGVSAFNFSGSGAEAIAAAGTSLGEMAISVKKWVDVKVPENIGESLKSLANGVSAFNFSGWGADAISSATSGVGDMASAVKKWANVTVPEGLGDVLKDLANGVSAFNFSGWGADAIESSTSGVGDMADAIKKWNGVTVPEGLESSLSGLARGVSAFNFSGWGADAIETLVSPLSRLADAVDKWGSINISDSIGDDLSNLASGVKSFTFGGWGADTINTVSSSMGSLGDSLVKLSNSNLNISQLGNDLTNLSTGISDLINSGISSAFNTSLSDFLYSFVNDSVRVAVINLGLLLDVFTGMSEIDLNGFSTFQTSLNNLGQISIDGLVLSLQNGVEKIQVTVESIGSTMQNAFGNVSLIVSPIANSTGSEIADVFISSLELKLGSLSTVISSSLSNQGTLLSTNSEVFFSSGEIIGEYVLDGFRSSISELSSSIGSSLSSLASSISTQSGGFESSGLALANSLTAGANSGSSNLLNAFASMIQATLSSIKNKQNEFKSAAQLVMTQFISGVSSKEASAKQETVSVINSMVTTINSSGNKFKSSAQTLMDRLIEGISSKEDASKTAIRGVTSSLSTVLREQYSSFYNAGRYLVQGFANGINDNTYLATARARAMANAAKTSAENELGIASPSKEFYQIAEYVVEGFTNGLADNTFEVEKASENLGETVIDSTTETLEIDSGTSELAKKVIGESFVNGIAEGITSNMSAEEAAEKKAENIIQAFENALSKIDFSSESLDLEQQLWEALNQNTASSAEKDEAKMETLLKEYEYQQERIELAKAEYQTMVQEFGKDSQEAKESYNRLLEQQIELANLSNEIADLKEAELEREQDILDKRDELAEHEYAIWKNQNSQTMTEQQEALADLALLTKQYDIQKERMQAALDNYHEVVSIFGSNANETYEAYSKYLSEYEELSDLFSQLTEAREEQLSSNSSEAYRLYNNFLNSYKKQLLSEGFSMEEIYEKAIEASKSSGFDIDNTIQSMDDAVRKAIDSATNTIKNSYMETIENTFGSLSPTFEEQGANLASFIGEGIQNGLNTISDKSVDLIQESFGSISDQSDYFSKMGESIADDFVSGLQFGLEQKGESESQLMTVGQSLANTFSASVNLTSVGESVLQKVAEGMQNEENNLNKELSNILASLSNTTRSEYSNFRNAGKYLVEGFALGITENTFLAEAKARAMARKAYEAAMSELNAHSPSKLFEEVGSYVPMGFAKGIGTHQKDVELSASNMAASAIESTRSTISRLYEIINDDIETTPVIKPVLDLTNITDGSKKLNALFSRNRASSIQKSLSARYSETESTKSKDDSYSGGVTNTFIQNNYSPKALSRVDIYRQTKNQFSAYTRGTKA